MSKFKVGDKVRLVGNTSGSVNKIGDVGIITDTSGRDDTEYRVKVGDQADFCNWSYESDLELATTNTLQVGQTYTSENGDEWECIFVRGDKAWMLGVYPDAASGSAYDFDIDGTASWAGGHGSAGYNIKWGPKRETVKTRFSIGVSNKDALDGVDNHVANITFDIIDGTPDWTTAVISAA